MLPWRYRVIPRAVCFRAALLAWSVAILPILATASVQGEFHHTVRLVSTDPAPLCVAPGVGALKIDWVQIGMQAAWETAPAMLGLPLPESQVAVILSADRHQHSLQLQQRFGLSETPNAPAVCSADVFSENRAILCDASRFGSRAGAIMATAHELTHHLMPEGSYGESGLPAWYHEGLAEYVATHVLADHLQRTRYSAEGLDWREWGTRAATAPYLPAIVWTMHEGAVADEARLGRYMVLDEPWTASPVEYSWAALAVRRLVERYGTHAVVGLARDTARSGSYTAAVVDNFGLTKLEFEQQLQAELRDRALARRW